MGEILSMHIRIIAWQRRAFSEFKDDLETVQMIQKSLAERSLLAKAKS